MRVVTGALVNEPGDLDHLARRRTRCRQQLRHPRVVVRSVVDDYPGVGDLTRRRCARLELVGILAGIGEDARDFHVGSADLLRDIAVHVLGSHDPDRRRARGGSAQYQAGNSGDDEVSHVGFVANIREPVDRASGLACR